MMLRYSDVETFVNAGFTSLGYGTSGHPDMPLLNPGPPTIASLQKLTPNALVFLTVGNGVGLVQEGMYDQPFIVVRALGPQNDYASAEQLAIDVDGMLLSVETQMVGSSRVLFITRNAPPQLVDYDSSSRYHFQTTYITEAQR